MQGFSKNAVNTDAGTIAWILTGQSTHLIVPSAAIVHRFEA